MSVFQQALNKIYFGGLLSIPVVLIVLPSNFFDNGQSVCLSVPLFNRTCPTCGLTRSIQHLLHFDWHTAAEYNKLAFIIVPILIIVWIMELIRVYRLLKSTKETN